MTCAAGVLDTTSSVWQRSIRFLVFLLAIVAFALTFVDRAVAQSVPPPATQYSFDPNGVEVISGAIFIQSPAIAIGQPGMGGLTYQRTYDSNIQDWRDNVSSGINLENSIYTVTLFGSSETFTLSGGVFSSNEEQGGTLTYNSTTQIYTYTTSSGAIAVYDKALAGEHPTQANEGRATTVTLPTGEVFTFTYTTLTASGFLAQRLQSLTNTLGYQLSFRYASNTADATGITLVEVMGLNNAIDYCAPASNGCSGLSQTWPTLTFDADDPENPTWETVTDAASRSVRYSFTGDRITGIRWPTATSDNIIIAYDEDDRVESVQHGSGTWGYAYSDSGHIRTTTVSQPGGHTQLFVSNLSISRVVAYQNGTGDVTQYTYEAGNNRLSSTVAPLGDYFRYTYDGRGNLIRLRQFPNSLGGASAFDVFTAEYPTTCATVVTCNLPTSTTDARGYRTDYTYDSTHGGVLTVTSPAPSGSTPVGSGVRPQTRYAHSQVSAWYKNSGGTIVQAPTPVYRLTSVSSCATSGSCSGGADETLTTITYGASNQANNLLPTVVASGAGNGSLTATTTSIYDAVGDVVSVNGPLSGDADTNWFRYDVVRQRVGVIGPDPDGGGSLLHRAVRYTYNNNGQVTSVERGTVNSPSNGDWAAFASLEQLAVSYDSAGRRAQDSLIASGTTYSVVQYNYDNASRVLCTATRMNPAVFNALPTACVLSTEGANGPDRISRNIYDGANRIMNVESGVGTPLQQYMLTQTYTDNGQLETLRDASTALTTYEYDGINRLRKIRYPNPVITGSSTTDYEEFSYDLNGAVTQHRLRDGNNVGFSYDNLNRLIAVDAPSGTDDLAYAYDNFGRMTSSATSAQTLTFAYDQLSRNTSVAGPLGTVSYEYDIAGRRTRVTWPDAFYAQYDYDLTNAVIRIRENGAGSGIGLLASYTYDNLGRRISITRGNGVTTNYGYDAASRLTSLQQDLASSASDQTLGFTYNATSQVITRTSSNAAYDWTQPAISAETYTSTRQNQYTTIAGANVSYDARGNLTAVAGGPSYGYDAFNRLTSANGATLGYDAGGRLYQETASSVTTRFLYDGTDLIGEYNTSGVLQRRYVHGPAFDEPVVWYEGSGTSDRRWLIADQLGSIIAVADEDGDALNINSYDEYGRPGLSNAGRFQYTGQVWLDSADVYHYKARAYDPLLGRFLQTDPIGYAGGLNLYMCMENDPVNMVDPMGLQSWGTSKPKRDPEIQVWGSRTMSAFEFGTFMAAYGGGGTTGANTGPNSEVDRDEIVVTAKQRRDGNPCASLPPSLLVFLRSQMSVSGGLNVRAAFTGRTTEAGGAGTISGGQVVPGATHMGRSGAGGMDLITAREIFERNTGYQALFDWHTHPGVGVNGALYGFSSGDVRTTAQTTRDGFIGSFVVMPNEILFLSREEALSLRSGNVYLRTSGVRCP